MDQLVVGEGICAVKIVVQHIVSASSFAVLLKEWTNLARGLDISEKQIQVLRKKYFGEDINYNDLLNDLINQWKKKAGKGATLIALIHVLKLCDFIDIAENIESKYLQRLQEAFLREKKVEFLGKNVTVEELLSSSGVKCRTQDLLSFVSADILKNETTCQIVVNVLNFPQGFYYIERQLSSRNRLDSKVLLKCKHTDVFVFDSNDLNELPEDLKSEQIERSSAQLENLNASYIILDVPGHFDWLCDKSSRPIHLISMNNKGLYWIKSRGDMTNIQLHVHEQQNAIKERSFLAHLDGFQNQSICIADAPGMGKTEMLKNLARNLQHKHPDRVVLFLPYVAITSKLTATENKIDSAEAIRLVSAVCSVSKLGCEVLKCLFLSNKQFEIFLDGFDEVQPTFQARALEFLMQLQTLSNVRLYVSTRTDVQNVVEKVCRQMGYGIQPLSKRDQVAYLCKFWCPKTTSFTIDTSLKRFAKICLENLREATKDERITETPLVCNILGEVFSKEADKFCQSGEQANFNLPIWSLYNLYKELISRKLTFSRSKNDTVSRTLLRGAHIRAAFFTVFSGETLSLNCVPSFNDTKIANEDILQIGLVETCLEKSASFSHRTFAEFFVADHLVSEIMKGSPCKACMKFLLETVLGQTCLVKDNFTQEFGVDSLSSERFHHSMIAYFVDSKMKDFQFKIKDPISRIAASRELIGKIGPYKTLIACCIGNYTYAFDIVRLIYFPDTVNLCHSSGTHDILKDMLLFASHYSDNIGLVKSVIRLMGEGDDNKLCKMKFPESKIYNIEITPLHISAYKGNSNVARYFLSGHYRTEKKHLERVLRFCLRKSILNSKETIENKKQIIKEFLKCIFQEMKENPYSSKLAFWIQPHIHHQLLETILKEKVSINDTLPDGDNILHVLFKRLNGVQHVDSKLYTKLFLLFKENGFKRWKEVNHLGQGALHLAVENVEVEDEILMLYKSLGVDFNSCDEHKNSVLFFAIRGGRTAIFLKDLVTKYGADVNHRNSHNHTALHFAAAYGNYDAVRFLLDVQANMINEQDWAKNSPLHMAVIQNSPEHRLIQKYLIKNNADLEIRDFMGNSPLVDGFKNGSGLSYDVVCEMENFGLDLENDSNAVLTSMITNKNLLASDTEYKSTFQLFYIKNGTINMSTSDKHNIVKNHFIEYEKNCMYIGSLCSKLLEIAKERPNEKGTVATAVDKLISEEISFESFLLSVLLANQEAFEKLRIFLANQLRKEVTFTAPRSNILILECTNFKILYDRVLEIVEGWQEFKEGDMAFSTQDLVIKREVVSKSDLVELGRKETKFIVVTKHANYDVKMEYNVKNVNETKEYKKLYLMLEKAIGNLARCSGFNISNTMNRKFYNILQNESFEVLKMNKQYLVTIVEEYVNGIDDYEKLFLIEMAAEVLLPATEFFKNSVVTFSDKLEKNLVKRNILESRSNKVQFKYECIGWYFLAHKITQLLSDSEDMETLFNQVFETVEVEIATIKTYDFRYKMLVYFIDHRRLGNLNYECSSAFQEACLVSKSYSLFNLILKSRRKLNAHPPILHLLVRETYGLPHNVVKELKSSIVYLLEKNQELLNSKIGESVCERTPLQMDGIHVELIEMLIKKGASPKITMSGKPTCIHLAATYLPLYQFQTLVDFLVSNNYEDVLKCKDSQGQTPIHIAIQHIEIDPATLDKLCTLGLDIHARDDKGKDVFSYAVSSNRSGFLQNYLLRKDFRDISELSALEAKIPPSVLAVATTGNTIPKITSELQLQPLYLYQNVAQKIQSPDEGMLEEPEATPIIEGRYERYCTKCGNVIHNAAYDKGPKKACIKCNHPLDYRNSSDGAWHRCILCDVFVNQLFRYCYMCSRKNVHYVGKHKSRVRKQSEDDPPSTPKELKRPGLPILKGRLGRFCIQCNSVIPNAAVEKSTADGCEACKGSIEFKKGKCPTWQCCTNCEAFNRRTFAFCYLCGEQNQYHEPNDTSQVETTLQNLPEAEAVVPKESLLDRCLRHIW